jgi:endogenous inhibitor of DNA gyrase (YacG/DUF329 family)
MTDYEKQKIRELRSEGLGYIKIANETGLNINSVKSFCRRNGLTGQPSKKDGTEGHRCLNCGKPVEQTPGKREKKFCCNACRWHYWNTHKELVNRRAVYHYTCAACGKQFDAYGNRHRKYCSHICYIRARFGGEDNEE